MSERILVFAKSPVLGKVKTRLAAELGEENALIIYKQLLNYTKTVVEPFFAQGLTVEIHIDQKREVDELFWDPLTIYSQVDGDLGHRMYSAVEMNQSEKPVKNILIGSDCFEIQQKHIQQALDALDHVDVVFGPARDGGYYLLGMKQIEKGLFYDMPWSQKNLLVRSKNYLLERGVLYEQLEVLNDVDYRKDLHSDHINSLMK